MRARLVWLFAFCAACHASSVVPESTPEQTVDAAAGAPPSDAGAPEVEAGPRADAGTEDAATEPTDAADAALPPETGSQSPLPAAVRADMTGKSWRPGCPVGLDDLALLDVPYVDFDGVSHRGELVVARSVAAAVLQAFDALYTQHFPIARMRRVDAYDADDDLSMVDDNTSAFNCRAVTGGSSWSAHSYGTAIDVNPRENPYVKGQTVLPPEGAEYLDRTNVRPGMAVEGSALVVAFDALGWGWGGRWTSPKDHQHFSQDGH